MAGGVGVVGVVVRRRDEPHPLEEGVVDGRGSVDELQPRGVDEAVQADSEPAGADGPDAGVGGEEELEEGVRGAGVEGVAGGGAGVAVVDGVVRPEEGVRAVNPPMRVHLDDVDGEEEGQRVGRHAEGGGGGGERVGAVWKKAGVPEGGEE